MNFECDECGKMFDSPNYGVGWEIARTDFSDGGPSVRIGYAATVLNFCSPECREGTARTKLLGDKGIKITYPDIGPQEVCSGCGGMVDMAQSHYGLTQSADRMDTEGGVTQEDLEYLAVLCTRCKPVGKSG